MRLSIIISLIMIIAFCVIGYNLYIFFFTGSEHTIENIMIDAWYEEKSIDIIEVEHWWITVEFEDSIPQMYFFKGDNLFVKNGKQKADNAWEKIEPLIGSEVRFEYYIERKGNELSYFKGISMLS